VDRVALDLVQERFQGSVLLEAGPDATIPPQLPWVEPEGPSILDATQVALVTHAAGAHAIKHIIAPGPDAK
jgi:hypothetical protein